MKLVNSQGKRYYGIHFYPGVAQYQDTPEQEPYRVFLNEDTLRSMDPSFAVKPVFVEHVDEVNPNLDHLRKEADGWVIRSFFNEADGKHWVEFIVVSERGERAIQQGMRLSNAYLPTSFRQGGLWNGVDYAKEITHAEYEHLAIVKNPRYEESVILTPEEFKKYNEAQVLELKRLANSKGEPKMKFSFFKKTKIDNALDSELQVILPKSGREVTITQLINEMDEKEADKNSGLADMSHKVKMDDGSYCNVGELLEKHKAMKDELESMKSKKEDEMVSEGEMAPEEKPVDSESVPEEKVNEEDEKKKAQLAENEEKEMKEAKKKNEAKAKAERLKNAHLNQAQPEAVSIQLSADRVVLGKARYGSN